MGDNALVFLDIDGVCHPATHAGGDAASDMLFVDGSMRLLVAVATAVTPPAAVVLTSTWRKSPGLAARAHAALKRYGLRVAGATDVLGGAGVAVRQAEICHYLRNFPATCFVVLDDLPLAATPSRGLWGHGAFATLGDHCVRPAPASGLQPSDATQAQAILRHRRWTGENFDVET
ncbi:hypothetical protein ACHHYP_15867 [Achlya hypogyna]|uniref:Polynucleotide kinase n=1 Tax=Achlya hypogyna TaxID=1202772 RepID=A0A1V9Y9Z6_ACHHY|nr:hypothetical protein ACHHYP_15867 [Achlya hypogyna]